MSCETCVVLSPHPDDATFSLGCTIRQNPEAKKFLVITVFSKSSFARPHIGLSAEEIMQLRRAEDRMFCEYAGAELISLGLLDAPDRLDLPLARIFEASDQMDCGDVKEVYFAIHSALRGIEVRNLFAPLGIGGHIDHVITREASKLLAIELGCELLFYADQPYYSEMTKDERKLALHGYRLLNKLDVGSEKSLARDKEVQAKLYKSQPASDRVINALMTPRQVFQEAIFTLDNRKVEDIS